MPLEKLKNTQTLDALVRWHFRASECEQWDSRCPTNFQYWWSHILNIAIVIYIKYAEDPCTLGPLDQAQASLCRMWLLAKQISCGLPGLHLGCTGGVSGRNPNLFIHTPPVGCPCLPDLGPCLPPVAPWLLSLKDLPPSALPKLPMSF